jgi:hypothetical protein
MSLFVIVAFALVVIIMSELLPLPDETEDEMIDRQW